MLRESIESDIRRIMRDDPIGNEDTPTTSGSAGGSNSLDLSPRAIERFHTEFRRDDNSAIVLAGIMVEVVDGTTDWVVVHPSALGPQGI